MGLDAGRGTTRVTSVASALQPEVQGVRRHRVDHGALRKTQSSSVRHAASLAEATPEV